ncbi:Pr6Pr family membrane protein [Streptomyces sp. NPDC001339]|uniref:Pr6Pr family membrane protein n=1 Tax=Streptomyces sp. NPDC001339 TaxID=3364563 RepID=UPI0036C6A0FB
MFDLLDLAMLGESVSLALQAGKTVADQVSYFTFLSNLLATVVLLAGAWPWTGRDSRIYDLLRVAATTYMVITGIVYNLLLSHTLLGMSALVNTVHHRIMPVVVVLDRLIAPVRQRPTRRARLLVPLLPLLYVVYTEVRGLAVDWYPYYFLDPRPHGYGRVALYVGAMIVSGALLKLLKLLKPGTTFVGRAVARRRRGRAGRPGQPPGHDGEQ